MLYATVRQRKIHVKNPTTVIQNGVNVDQLILDMDDEWKSMDTIVCVFQNGEVSREMLHTFGEPVQVPWECLGETGNLSLSCTGYVGEEKVMTTMLPDSFWTVVQNGAVTADAPMEPTPTLYQQVLSAAGAAQSAAQKAHTAADDLLSAAAAGAFDGAAGQAATVELGTVTTGETGTPAMVTNTGTPQNAVLNFVLPRGERGARGEDGVDGKDGKDGAPGKDGADGLTPYIGNNGNWWIGASDTGVKAEGTDGINGKDGTDGKDGNDGYTPVKGVDYFDGKDGSDATVTAASIKKALGYTPMPMSESVTSGRFAVSDGAGGITWLALTNVSEVGA